LPALVEVPLRLVLPSEQERIAAVDVSRRRQELVAAVERGGAAEVSDLLLQFLVYEPRLTSAEEVVPILFERPQPFLELGAHRQQHGGRGAEEACVFVQARRGVCFLEGDR